VAYGRGAGVDTRWLVIDCSLPFFSVTKRLHNRLHGVAGYDGDLGDDARALYAEVQERNLRALEALVRPGDIVLLHDPQTAGPVFGLQRAPRTSCSGATSGATSRTTSRSRHSRSSMTSCHPPRLSSSPSVKDMAGLLTGFVEQLQLT